MDQPYNTRPEQAGAISGTCHCGRVTLRVPSRPDYLNACNCTLCMKLGTLWGYFPCSQVEIEGVTRAYVRSDVDQAYLSAHFCGECGATTNWSPLPHDAPDRMGVNMRLFDPAELVGIEVRYGDRRSQDALEPRRYYREPTVFDGAGATP